MSADTPDPPAQPRPPALVAVVRKRRHRWRQPLGGPRFPVLTALAVVPAVTIVAMIVLIMAVSLRRDIFDPAFTTSHFRALFSDSFAWTALRNTAGFATVTLFVAAAFGIPLAWLVERSDLRGKSVITTIMTMGILLPGFFTAIAWLQLLHPRIGWFNQVLAEHLHITLSVATLPGMGWVQGLGLAPLFFVMTASALRAMDDSLEEAALMAGAGRLTVLRRVTLPLLAPGLLGAAIYVLTIAVAAFDVPLIIGLSNRIYTFSTYLFLQVSPQAGLPNYGGTAAFAALMIGFGLVLGVVYTRVLTHARRYQVVSGKGYRPRLVELGAWRAAAWAFVGSWLMLAILLPLTMVVWTALQPFGAPPSLSALKLVTLDNFRAIDWSVVRRGIEHTALLTLLAPTIAMTFAVAFGWVVLRSRSRLRLVLDFIAFLPHAVPSSIFAFAGLVATLRWVRWFNLYGSLTALIIVIALAQLPFATRVTNAALIQVSDELEESAYMAGARSATVLRRITLPLIRPALLYGWLWLALLAFREFTISTVMASPRNITLPALVWDQFRGSGAGEAAAVVIVMTALLFPLVGLYWRLGRSRGTEAADLATSSALPAKATA